MALFMRVGCEILASHEQFIRRATVVVAVIQGTGEGSVKLVRHFPTLHN